MRHHFKIKFKNGSAYFYFSTKDYPKGFESPRRCRFKVLEKIKQLKREFAEKGLPDEEFEYKEYEI